MDLYLKNSSVFPNNTEHIETASISGIYMDLNVLLKLHIDLYLKILLCHYDLFNSVYKRH